MRNLLKNNPATITTRSHPLTFVPTLESLFLEKTLESPLDYKEIQPVNPKGNQS